MENTSESLFLLELLKNSCVEVRKKLISVIVPVYKTEQYLKKCIDSILGQTYKNLEIILVNDGSPDNSLALMQEYTHIDNRIKIVNKANGGLSSARNAGLKIATGEYITFVDSDDYLELDIYQKVMDIFDKHSVDVVSMRMQNVDEQYNIIDNDIVKDVLLGVCSGRYYVKQMAERKFSASVCSKIFTRNIINREFDENRLNEDFLFLSHLFLDENCKIFITNDIGYNYFTRTNSITKSGYGKSLQDAVYNTKDLFQYYQTDVELRQIFGAFAVYQARTCIIMMSKRQFKEEKEFVRVCKTIIKGNRKYIKHSFMAFKDRIFCYSFSIFPNLTKRIVDFMR